MCTPYYLANTLTLIINHSSIPERSESAAEFVQGLPDDWRVAAVWRVNERYRQRGDVARLRAFARARPRKQSVVKLEIYLVRTLIEQGQAEAGLRLLARVSECRDVELALIVRALHKRRAHAGRPNLRRRAPRPPASRRLPARTTQPTRSRHASSVHPLRRGAGNPSIRLQHDPPVGAGIYRMGAA
jgi:hypothetical protein